MLDGDRRRNLRPYGIADQYDRTRGELTERVTDNRGQVAWDLWNDPAVGNKSEPVVMDMATMALPGEVADIDGDGTVSVTDLLEVLGLWGPCPPGPCIADLNCDGVVGVPDLLIILARWGFTG